jgi:hypothetical protein
MFLSEFTALAPVELANLVTGPRQKCNLRTYIVNRRETRDERREILPSKGPICDYTMHDAIIFL